MAAYDMASVAIRIGKTATKNFGYLASGNYFDTLGVQPALGRFFRERRTRRRLDSLHCSETDSGVRIHNDPNILGTTIDLNKQPFTIIGVASKEFHGTETFFWPDFWIPITNGPLMDTAPTILKTAVPRIRGCWRLKPGVTPQQASDDLNAICRQLAEQYPSADYGLDARLVEPGLMGDMFGDPVRGFLGE